MLGPAFVGGLLGFPFSPDVALGVFAIPAVSYGIGRTLKFVSSALPQKIPAPK